MTFMCAARVFTSQTFCVNTALGDIIVFSVCKKHVIPHLSEEINDIDTVFLIIHLAISIMDCWSMKYSKYKIDYEVDGQ